MARHGVASRHVPQKLKVCVLEHHVIRAKSLAHTRLVDEAIVQTRRTHAKADVDIAITPDLKHNLATDGWPIGARTDLEDPLGLGRPN